MVRVRLFSEAMLAVYRSLDHRSLHKKGPKPGWLRSFLCRRSAVGLGGIDLSGAGDGVLLVLHHGADQLHGAAKP